MHLYDHDLITFALLTVVASGIKLHNLNDLHARRGRHRVMSLAIPQTSHHTRASGCKITSYQWLTITRERLVMLRLALEVATQPWRNAQRIVEGVCLSEFSSRDSTVLVLVHACKDLVNQHFLVGGHLMSELLARDIAVRVQVEPVEYEVRLLQQVLV